MGVSVWSLLIVLLIVALLFGTKRLRNIGGDLGSAIRGFKDSVQSGEQDGGREESEQPRQGSSTIEHQSSNSADSDRSRSQDAAGQHDRSSH
ncbi:twin-arginine translocase TatA/TatE family subunit [Halorhodospira halochloris]|uniref:Sec-independent protein translocase protein TatA n=1 Tax=Halorhodospira halochloris TaxID=1052 RepID=A0A0X8X715_HALHR|nr:twin-arginine translocase TatA/TatE family subunit [Halorhodospira halochloris]MBK1650733.1 hypothetical protein [Halorhodospira halochloris]MCG5530937.1 twin-arginine translocase TatA/TatE family subunit [Halorhodospira halochloris]MCG5549156.1 twin-arginine translocase TatA/TatE family subunit [Halorhodospira halochloris]BAU56774.1 twin-arginine translocation protein TatA [Halorhodospira halochloris]